MTNDEIKSNLLKLFSCEKDFNVIQTGKKSSKVNGFYKPDSCEIYLHNKNFSTDNEVMYTAIHELTHHVLTTEKGVKSAKCHSGIFWATFYDFLDRAIELGFYNRTRSEETLKLIQEAKEVQKQINEAQKQLGAVISKIFTSCEENNERIEDVIEHDLQISRKKAKELIVMKSVDTEQSDEMTKVINSAKEDQKQAAIDAAEKGKTVEQVKAIAKQKAKAVDDDLEDPTQLRREKARLEKTIEQLNNRLVQVEETLISMGDNL